MPLKTDRELLTATLAQLRAPFDRKLIGKLPATEKRPALDFVGHAAVTDRLNSFAPDWTYTIDERFDHGGQCWVRITMNILGIERSDYGDGSDPKEAIGNALRRTAMRYGVALDLWSKEELLPAAGGAGSHAPAPKVENPSSDLPPVAATSGDTQSTAPDTSDGAGDNAVGKGVPGPADDTHHFKPVTHVATWEPSPTLSKFEVCTFDGCLRTRRKTAVAS